MSGIAILTIVVLAASTLALFTVIFFLVDRLGRTRRELDREQQEAEESEGRIIKLIKILEAAFDESRRS